MQQPTAELVLNSGNRSNLLADWKIPCSLAMSANTCAVSIISSILSTS